jgi:predicted transposase/invertase (TIGR01784 family)
MYANEKFKDSVFSTLFGNEDVLRELYSAIEGVEVPRDTHIDINTLEKVLVKGKINDLSFIIGNRLVVLIEHQSSINNNMPLRLLLYIAEVYQNITSQKALLQQKLVKIPTPEFIVLYNGKAPFDDYKKMRLSDAFKDVEGLKLPQEKCLSLELVVHVYNINYGRNPGLLEKSSILNGYSIFIDKIREYQAGGLTLEESLKAAVEYCIKNDILKPFMEAHRSEVVKMLLEEWTMEDELAVAKDEGRDETREEIARNALKEGASLEFVQKITGLPVEQIEQL